MICIGIDPGASGGITQSISSIVRQTSECLSQAIPSHTHSNFREPRNAPGWIRRPQGFVRRCFAGRSQCDEQLQTQSDICQEHAPLPADVQQHSSFGRWGDRGRIQEHAHRCDHVYSYGLLTNFCCCHLISRQSSILGSCTLSVGSRPTLRSFGNCSVL